MKLPDYLKSVRSLLTLMIGVTFCAMALMGKVDAKDFMLIVSVTINFYFIGKRRDGTEKNGDG